jgi:hypothetical protein
VQDIHVVAILAQSLSVHLWESWPVKGEGQPVAGLPTNFTVNDLYRHLVHLKTILVRFHPPDEPAAQSAWLKSRGCLAQGMLSSLGRIELVCNQLIDQFGWKEAFASIDGQKKVILKPTLNTARIWQPPDGCPMPEIDRQDIRSLEWAAARLFQTLAENASGQDQPVNPPPGGKEPESAPPRDGLEPPNWFYWQNTRHELSPRLWAILKCLWNNDRVKAEELVERVWGDEGEIVADGTIRGRLSELNTRLANIGVPWQFHLRKGFVVKG